MNPRIREILLEIARKMVHEAEEWERVYGSKAPRAGSSEETRQNHARLSQEVEDFRRCKADELIALGHPVYTVMITGCSPSDGPGNYEIENRIVHEFGDLVLPDSEHSQLFIMTTEEHQEAVLARICELAGTGTVETYGGHVYESEFHTSVEDNPHISGLGNWTAAKNLVDYLEAQEILEENG